MLRTEIACMRARAVVWMERQRRRFWNYRSVTGVTCCKQFFRYIAERCVLLVAVEGLIASCLKRITVHSNVSVEEQRNFKFVQTIESSRLLCRLFHKLAIWLFGANGYICLLDVLLGCESCRSRKLQLRGCLEAVMLSWCCECVIHRVW
jgi:hypothetical protein